MGAAPLRYAVFGQPIAHSLSPRIHAAFGEQCGIALEYRAIEAGLDDFPRVLADFAAAGGRGANVTLPLKQAARGLCVGVSERAARADSVNTLIRADDGWHGDSTDGAGFLVDLRARQGFDPAGRRVLLAGAGGAARAVAFALADAGVAALAILNRSRARAEALAAALGGGALVLAPEQLVEAPAFDLVVNASSAGHAGAPFTLPGARFSARSLAYDLSYGRAAAPFLAWAGHAGIARRVDGLGMLVEQAAESFRLWHGRRPDTAPVHAALAG